MSNGNGTNGTFKILGWIGGAIAFMITIYTVFHVPVLQAIDKVAECSQTRDNEIVRNVSVKLDYIISQNTDMKVALAGISQQVLVNTKRLDKIENGR